MSEKRSTDAVLAARMERTAVMMERRRGFTLIELLVVIAIIALLIALLLPSLNMAKEAARASMSASNQRQMALGSHSYAVENGVYPVGKRNSNNSWIWPSLIREHISGSRDTSVFHCPSARDETRWVVKFGSGLPARDGYEGDEVPLVDLVQLLSYGYNVWGQNARPEPDLGRVAGFGISIDAGPEYGAAALDAVLLPSGMIMFADSNYDDETASKRWSGFIGNYRQDQYPSQIHSGKANVSFADGHVERLARNEVVSLSWSSVTLAESVFVRRWNLDYEARDVTGRSGGRGGGRQ